MHFDDALCIGRGDAVLLCKRCNVVWFTPREPRIGFAASLSLV